MAHETDVMSVNYAYCYFAAKLEISFGADAHIWQFEISISAVLHFFCILQLIFDIFIFLNVLVDFEPWCYFTLRNITVAVARQCIYIYTCTSAFLAIYKPIPKTQAYYICMYDFLCLGVWNRLKTRHTFCYKYSFHITMLMHYRSD